MNHLVTELQRTARDLVRCNNVLEVTHAYRNLSASVWLEYWIDLNIEIELIKEQNRERKDSVEKDQAPPVVETAGR